MCHRLLEYVAIDPDGARTQLLEIDRSPDGTPDEALDFLRTSIDAPFGGIPLLTGQSGVGKHGIFGGDPAPSFFCSFIQRGTFSSMVTPQTTASVPIRSGWNLSHVGQYDFESEWI